MFALVFAQPCKKQGSLPLLMSFLIVLYVNVAYWGFNSTDFQAQVSLQEQLNREIPWADLISGAGSDYDSLHAEVPDKYPVTDEFVLPDFDFSTRIEIKSDDSSSPLDDLIDDDSDDDDAELDDGGEGGEAEGLPNYSNISATALYLTTGIGTLFIVTISSCFICLRFRSCQVDCAYSTDYDAVDDPS
jgi:hypothetical protein